MIKANQADADAFRARTMCELLGVSASGYYGWRDRPPSARARENEALGKRIEEVYVASDGIYGMPKIWHELRDPNDEHFEPRWGKVGRNRIARLMRKAGLKGISRRRGYVITTERDGTARAAPDLVNRQFEAHGPNELWVSDITYGTPRQRSPPQRGSSCLSMTGMHCS